MIYGISGSIATLRCGRPTEVADYYEDPIEETFQSQPCDAADLPHDLSASNHACWRFNRNSAMRPTYQTNSNSAERAASVSIATLRCGRPTKQTRTRRSVLQAFQSQLCDAADLPPALHLCSSCCYLSRFNRNSAMRPTYR